MAWLIQITRQQGLIVSQMTVTPTPTPGMVSVDLILKGN
jgi:type II secretory pathway component PulM